MEDILVVAGVLILDSSGKRILAKYFTDKFSQKEKQLEFETRLLQKSSRSGGGRTEIDVLLLDSWTIVCRNDAEVNFFVFGSNTENEVILSNVLQTIYDTLRQLFSDQFDVRTLFEHFDALVVTLDEILDDGVIMELDVDTVVSRVVLQGEDHVGGSQHEDGGEGIPWKQLKDRIVRSFFRT